MKYFSVLQNNNKAVDDSVLRLHAENAKLSMEKKINDLNSKKNSLQLERMQLESSIKTDDGMDWVTKMLDLSKKTKIVEAEIELAKAMQKEWFNESADYIFGVKTGNASKSEQ